MLPITVNAYYNPTSNEIVLSAAVLQPPFFSIQRQKFKIIYYINMYIINYIYIYHVITL